MNLPEGAHLAYVVFREAWYCEANRHVTTDPELLISASYPGGGVAWEFKITEHPYNGGCVRVQMFDDAFDAWAQVPELFELLRETSTHSLGDVRVILSALGAVDETPRHGPYTSD